MAPASPLTARHREIQLRPPTLKTPFYARPACRDTRAPPLLSPLKVARRFGISALQDLPENSWNSWNIIGWVHGREKERERRIFRKFEDRFIGGGEKNFYYFISWLNFRTLLLRAISPLLRQKCAQWSPATEFTLHCNPQCVDGFIGKKNFSRNGVFITFKYIHIF